MHNGSKFNFVVKCLPLKLFAKYVLSLFHLFYEFVLGLYNMIQSYA